MKTLTEFRPALMFLAKFLGIYLVGNVLYGIWIESSGERADAGTAWVASQTVRCLQVAGFETYAKANPDGPTVFLMEKDDVVLSVFEGCNGVNVMIVFTAFLVAFGGPGRSMAWFLLLGLLIIHLSNLLRISLLYYTAIHQPAYFYYFHKYFFTAVLYLVVFVLWALWVVKFNARPGAKAIH